MKLNRISGRKSLVAVAIALPVCVCLAISLGNSAHAQACNLYPIALSAQSLSNAAPGTVLTDIYNGVQPGNFGWLSWAGSPDVGTLVRSLTPPGDSATYVNPDNPEDHQINIGDWIQGAPGVSNSKNVRNALDILATREITVPVWDQSRGTGANAAYRVCAFAQVRILSYRLANQNRITARFLGYVTCEPTNTPPIAYTAAVTTTQNTPVEIILRGFDLEGAPLTYSIINGPVNGTLSGTPPIVTYTPTENYVGSDTFQFTVNDGTNESAPATVSITVQPITQGLVVDAGPDQLITLPASATLNGVVNFQSAQGPERIVHWTVVDGPGVVTFSNPSNAVTTATFSESGIYQLRLFASDGLLSGTDDVIIIANQPPSVWAGPNQTCTLPAVVTMQGSVEDDGLPTNEVLTVTWSKVSGPGSVTFAEPDETNTTVSFSEPGVYVLRLSANDGVASASSDVVITVNERDSTQPPGCAQVGIPVKGYTALNNQSNFLYDIVFVIDTSGSTARGTGYDLNGDGREDTVFEAEVEACRRLLQILAETNYVRFGLVKFARYYTKNAPKGSISDGPIIPEQTRIVQDLTNDIAAIQVGLDTIASEGAKGGTHIAAGIDLAIGALTNAPPVGNDYKVTPVRHIILLTDGIPTLPVETGWTQERGDREATLEAARRAAAANIAIHAIVIDPTNRIERRLTTMPTVQNLTGVAGELIRINANNMHQLPDILSGIALTSIPKVTVFDHITGRKWSITVQPNGWFEAVLPASIGSNIWEFRFSSGELNSEQIVTRTVSFMVYPRDAVVDVVGLSASNPPVRELAYLERPTGGRLHDTGPELSLLAVLTNKAPEARLLPGVESFRTLSGTLTLEFIFKGAQYNSDVGYFMFDPANPPKSAAEVLASVGQTNVFLNSGIVPNNNLNVSGLTNTITVPPGVAVGLFMIPNGTLADAKAGRGNPPLFTLASLNPGQFDQALTFYDPVGGQIICAFEDINIISGESDQDFQDLIFTVKPVDPMPQYAECLD